MQFEMVYLLYAFETHFKHFSSNICLIPLPYACLYSLKATAKNACLYLLTLLLVPYALNLFRTFWTRCNS